MRATHRRRSMADKRSRGYSGAHVPRAPSKNELQRTTPASHGASPLNSVFDGRKERDEAQMTRSRIVGACAALVLTVLLGCSGNVDTEVRTLPSGLQVEVFRIFAQEGPRGTILNYFYSTPHFGDRAA